MRIGKCCGRSMPVALEPHLEQIRTMVSVPGADSYLVVRDGEPPELRPPVWTIRSLRELEALGP